MDQPDTGLLGRAATGDAEKRARGCARPVRLRGSTGLLKHTPGELGEV